MPVDLADEEGNTPLIVACQFGFGRIIKMLVRKDANINALNSRGDSPLHVAHAYHHKSVAKYLLSQVRLGQLEIYVVAKGATSIGVCLKA